MRDCEPRTEWVLELLHHQALYVKVMFKDLVTLPAQVVHVSASPCSIPLDKARPSHRSSVVFYSPVDGHWSLSCFWALQ